MTLDPESFHILLPRIASSELIMPFALTEPDAGSDVAGIESLRQRQVV